MAIMSNKYRIKIHDPFEGIDFTKFVEAERSSGTFEFYSISRVIKASVFFCGYIVAAYTVKNELIGFTYIFRCEEPESYFFSFIWVNEIFRNKGFAKLIHNEAIKEAKKRGAKSLYATCSPSNYMSLSLLMNDFGWSIGDFIDDFYGEGEHRFILKLDLREEEKTESYKTSSVIVEAEDGDNIKKLLKNGYKGTHVEVDENVVKMLFTKGVILDKLWIHKKAYEIDVVYEYDDKTGLLGVSVFPERVFYVELPFRSVSQKYIEFLSAIFTFATAVNLHNKRGNIVINTDFKIFSGFDEIINLYNQLQTNIRIKFSNVAKKNEKVSIDIKRGRDPIILFSGGKDSTFSLIQLLKSHEKGTLKALYIKGTTINAEYYKEVENAKRLCDKFGIELKTINVNHGDYEFNSLRVRNRARWRGFLLLALASLYSTKIHWGITRDPALHGNMEQFLRAPYSLVFFGDSLPVINLISEVLNVSVNLLPSEYEVFHQMLEEYPEILEQTHSCFNPIKKCDLENNWDRSCLKCRSLHIYKKIITKEPLTELELEHIKSPLWHGDPNIKDYL